MLTLEDGQLYHFGQPLPSGERLRYLASGEAGIAGVLVTVSNRGPEAGYLITWDGKIEAASGQVVGTTTDLQPLPAPGIDGAASL